MRGPHKNFKTGTELVKHIITKALPPLMIKQQPLFNIFLMGFSPIQYTEIVTRHIALGRFYQIILNTTLPADINNMNPFIMFFCHQRVTVVIEIDILFFALAFIDSLKEFIIY